MSRVIDKIASKDLPAENLRQLKAMGAIESDFKALGKYLYACWLDKDKTHNFEGIMQNFDKNLKSKLKETKK